MFPQLQIELASMLTALYCVTMNTLLCLGLIFHGNCLIIDNSHDMSYHVNCL